MKAVILRIEDEKEHKYIDTLTGLATEIIEEKYKPAIIMYAQSCIDNSEASYKEKVANTTIIKHKDTPDVKYYFEGTPLETYIKANLFRVQLITSTATDGANKVQVIEYAVLFSKDSDIDTKIKDIINSNKDKEKVKEREDKLVDEVQKCKAELFEEAKMV